MADYSSKTVVRSIGGPEEDEEGDFLISQAHHMAYNDGKIYISEMLSHVVRVFQATDSSLVKYFGGLGSDDGEFSVPGGIAFSNGKAVVCDVNNGRLQTFDADGNFLTVVGSKGDGPGCFANPHSLCVDTSSEHIFVAEATNKRVQVLDKEFNHKSFISGPPFSSCDRIGYDSANNRLIVSDCEADSVSLIDPATGQIVCKLEGEDEEFKGAQQATGDKAGNILVCEMGKGRVVVFDKDGKKIGPFASGYEFSNPEEILINDSGEILILEGRIFAGWSRVVVF